MKKILKFGKVLCLGALLSLSTFAKDLYVGTNAEFAPFAYLENGEVVGFDIDLINEVSKRLGTDIKLKNMAFDGLIPALQSNKVDVVIAGMTVTPDREKFVLFSKDYFVATQVMIVPEGNTDVTSLDNLKGKKVGVMLGYTGDLLVSKLEGVESVKYNNPSEAIMALKANKIDVVILDSAPAKSYVKNNPGLKTVEVNGVDNEAYAIAVQKKDKELLDKINQALDEINQDGTYDKLIEKYFN